MAYSPTTEEEARVYGGSCLCGGVAYRATGPFSVVARCHCVQCRKASGAEYATNGSVLRENFEIVRGDDLLSEFESSEGNFRVFCGRCGSPLFKRVDADDSKIRIRLGTLDDAYAGPVRFRTFTSRKLALTPLPDDDLMTFETAPGA